MPCDMGTAMAPETAKAFDDAYAALAGALVGKAVVCEVHKTMTTKKEMPNAYRGLFGRRV